MADLRDLLETWGWDTPRRDDWCSVRCGRHADRHPSARVSVTKGAYICFSCGLKAGSPVALAMAVLDLPYPAAKDYVAGLGIATEVEAPPSGRPVRRFTQRWHRKSWRGAR